jgi:hypothetical protein
VNEEIRCLILYPAGHGKTTIACTLLPIYWFCKDPNTRIALIAKNEVDAKGVMRSIHAELLGNEKLIRDFGEFEDGDNKSKAWSIERIDIKPAHDAAQGRLHPDLRLEGQRARQALRQGRLRRRRHREELVHP